MFLFDQNASAISLYPEITLLAQCGWDVVPEAYSAKAQVGRLPSIVELQVAINRFPAEKNDGPGPFDWTAHCDRVIAAVQRGTQVLESVH